MHSRHGARVEDPPAVLADPWNEEARDLPIFRFCFSPGGARQRRSVAPSGALTEKENR